MKNSFELRVEGVCMILAPLLFVISSFFWNQGEYGIDTGTLIILSMVFWIPAFSGLFGLLKEKMPRYASVGFLVAVYGCIGGSNFGFEGIYTSVFDIPHQETVKKFAEYPVHFNFTLFWPGPLFPLSILILGIVMIKKKILPLWVCIFLITGAVAFPISRIPPRIELLTHVSDALLLIPMSAIGWTFINSKKLVSPS